MTHPAVLELQTRLEKFSARWFELKPKRLDTGQREEMDQVIERVKEWQAEFTELEGQVEKLGTDCEHFGLEPPQVTPRWDPTPCVTPHWHPLTLPLHPPQLGGLDDLRADIESYMASCVLFEEYTTELDTLAKEDWISFRGRLWVFAARTFLEPSSNLP